MIGFTMIIAGLINHLVCMSYHHPLLVWNKSLQGHIEHHGLVEKGL